MSKCLELIRQLSTAVARKREIEDQLAEVQEVISGLKAEVLEAREAEGIGNNVELKNCLPVVFDDAGFSTSVKDDEAYSKWIEANGMQDIARWSVHWARTRKLTMELMDAGKEPPAGVEVSRFTQVKVGGKQI